MTIAEQIRLRLTEEFLPNVIEVEDESERHRGHSGWREGGETHFRVRLVSERLSGLTRLQQHRMVHQALSPEPLSSIHALSLDLASDLPS